MGRKPASDHSIHFAGGIVRDRCYVCAFFNTAEEEHKVLRSFMKEGLDAGEKGFHVVDANLRDDDMNRLAQADINVEQAIAAGQLEVRAWQEAYLRGDRFDQDAMLALVEKVLQSNAAAGYLRTRIVAHMESALLDKPGVDDLLECDNGELIPHSAGQCCARSSRKVEPRQRDQHVGRTASSSLASASALGQIRRQSKPSPWDVQGIWTDGSREPLRTPFRARYVLVS
jgi:hypothetical protein